MNRALWRKTIAEAQWLWLALAVLLFAFCWIRVWIVALFEMSRYAAIVEQFWDDYQQFFAVSLSDLLSYPVRVGMTYVEPVVMVAMAVWAIARGSAAVSGEIGRGTMEMLLAQPISRFQAFFAQSAVTVAGAALLALASWLGVWVGIQVNTVKVEGPAPTIRIPFTGVEIPNPLGQRQPRRVPMSSQVSARELAPAAFNLFSLGVCMAGIAAFFSSWDRYRWRTIGLTAGLLLVQLVIKGFAFSAPSLAWMKRWSLFTPYEPLRWIALEARERGQGWAFMAENAKTGLVEWGPSAHNAVLLGIGAATFTAAAIIFNRRDLPAPL
jgi:ABC-2 type transport system permease protein